MNTPALDDERQYRQWRWAIFKRFIAVVAVACLIGWLYHTGPDILLLGGAFTDVACLVLTAVDLFVMHPMLIMNKLGGIVVFNRHDSCSSVFPTILSHLLYYQSELGFWLAFGNDRSLVLLATPVMDAHQYALRGHSEAYLEMCDQEMFWYNVTMGLPWLCLLLAAVQDMVRSLF